VTDHRRQILAAELATRGVPAEWAPCLAAGILASLSGLVLRGLSPIAVASAVLCRPASRVEAEQVIGAMVAARLVVVVGDEVRRPGAQRSPEYWRERRMKAREVVGTATVAVPTIAPTPAPPTPEPRAQPEILLLTTETAPKPKRSRKVKQPDELATKASDCVAAWVAVHDRAVEAGVIVEIVRELPWGEASTRDRGLLTLLRQAPDIGPTEFALIAEWVYHDPRQRRKSESGWTVSVGFLVRTGRTGDRYEKVHQYLSRAQTWDQGGRRPIPVGRRSAADSLAEQAQAIGRDQPRQMRLVGGS